jgi:hypothetical protein
MAGIVLAIGIVWLAFMSWAFFGSNKGRSTPVRQRRLLMALFALLCLLVCAAAARDLLANLAFLPPRLE